MWFLWHIPLLYLPGQQTGCEAFPVVLFAATVILSSVLYTWLYNNTRGSILSVILLHAGLSIWGPLVALHPAETGDVLSVYSDCRLGTRHSQPRDRIRREVEHTKPREGLRGTW